MTAPSLVEFLHARIAEDEAEARKADEGGGANAPDFAVEGWPNWEHPGRCVIVGVERFLAECEAKRRIVEKAQRADAAFNQMVNPASSAASFALTEVLQYLALPYSDHPDWREEWRG